MDEIVSRVIIEGLFRGTGYLICRLFGRDDDFDSGAVLVVGIMFWIVALGLAIALMV